MYNDLKQLYWWLGMKQDTSEFVSRCLVCQQVKVEHQLPSRLLQPVMIPKWKWDRVTMDFVLGLPLSLKKKDTIWFVVDRLMNLHISYRLRSEVYVMILEEIARSLRKMALYKALYGCKCGTSLYWTELSEKNIHGVNLIREIEDNVKVIVKV
ncbi:integrase [Gossypium australe]|uniref:Integrase n=1 Tax=Gossypium australe TaxID=47621 RepID=A0A5B6VNN6_9ROSI|nr:integrase [Gossypium australe]